jgi:hypothetical protein
MSLPRPVMGLLYGYMNFIQSVAFVHIPRVKMMHFVFLVIPANYFTSIVEIEMSMHSDY